MNKGDEIFYFDSYQLPEHFIVNDRIFRGTILDDDSDRNFLIKDNGTGAEKIILQRLVGKTESELVSKYVELHIETQRLVEKVMRKKIGM